MNREISFEFRYQIECLLFGSSAELDVKFSTLDYSSWLLPISTGNDLSSFIVNAPYRLSSMSITDEFPDGLPPQEAFDFISKYIKSNGRYVKTN